MKGEKVMDNKQNEQIRKIQQRSIVPPVQPKPAVGECYAPVQSLNQINTTRRRNALIQARQLIKEYHFTIEEITETVQK